MLRWRGGRTDWQRRRPVEMATLCLTVNSGDPPLGKGPMRPTRVGCISLGWVRGGKVAAPWLCAVAIAVRDIRPPPFPPT